MISRWDDSELRDFAGNLGHRVYTSWLLGRDPSLVLHGGDNTSVKTLARDLYGDERRLLYLEGSGHGLHTIAADGFALLQIEPVLRPTQLPTLSDADMARALRLALADPAAPAPSVEAILHAALPASYVDHTHADAIITFSNCVDGEARVREVYGDDVVVVPYEDYLEARGAWQITVPEVPPPAQPQRVELARLRAEVARVAGTPMLMRAHQGSARARVRTARRHRP